MFTRRNFSVLSILQGIIEGDLTKIMPSLEASLLILKINNIETPLVVLFIQTVLLSDIGGQRLVIEKALVISRFPCIS